MLPRQAHQRNPQSRQQLAAGSREKARGGDAEELPLPCGWKVLSAMGICPWLEAPPPPPNHPKWTF